MANDFLFEQPKWIVALHHNYPDKMKELEKIEQSDQERLLERYPDTGSYPPEEEYSKLIPHPKNFIKQILSQFYPSTSPLVIC